MDWLIAVPLWLLVIFVGYLVVAVDRLQDVLGSIREAQDRQLSDR